MSMLFGPRRALLGGAVPATYADKVLGYGPIAYWPLWEAAGGVAVDQVNSPAQDGAYTGVTLGQPGIGDGRTCPFFDGANDVVNIWSAVLSAAFNGDEGSVMIWNRVFNAGVWTDGAARIACNLVFDGTNFIWVFSKDLTNNDLRADFFAGGVGYSTERPGGQVSVAWRLWTMTWSRIANEVKYYIDAVQSGLTDAGQGVWGGGLANGTTTIGAGVTAPPADVWHGWLAHCAIWDTPLTPAQIADLAVV